MRAGAAGTGKTDPGGQPGAVAQVCDASLDPVVQTVIRNRAADGRGPIIATADGECAPCKQVSVQVQPLAGRVWLPKAAYHRFVEQKTAASAE